MEQRSQIQKRYRITQQTIKNKPGNDNKTNKNARIYHKTRNRETTIKNNKKSGGGDANRPQRWRRGHAPPFDERRRYGAKTKRIDIEIHVSRCKTDRARHRLRKGYKQRNGYRIKHRAIYNLQRSGKRCQQKASETTKLHHSTIKKRKYATLRGEAVWELSSMTSLTAS